MESDRADFASWYEAERDSMVRALVLIAGDPDIAREVVAEAFTRAYERWRRVRAMESPTGWVYRVALNELRRRARRRALEARLLLRDRVDVIPAVDGHEEVWAAVRALPARQRQAVVLRYVGDLPEREVAQAMGITEGAASAALAEARRSLRTRLGDGEIEEAQRS